MGDDPSAETLDYLAVAERLTGSGLSMSVAELHGMITGLVCVPGDPGTAWIGEIIDDIDTEMLPRAEATRLLMRLYLQTQQQFSPGTFAFEPLLPDDAIALTERSMALGHWCAGFLFGFNAAGQTDFEMLPDDSRDVVRDIAKFAGIRASDGQDESEESAYMELVEYVRVGVMLINEELVAETRALETSPTIH